ncbi:MAG: right-handed parallel beta-helix repeat-containing protein, partial [Thermoplasmata archaeon]
MKSIGQLSVLGIISILLLTSMILINTEEARADFLSGPHPEPPAMEETLIVDAHEVTGDLYVPEDTVLTIPGGASLTFPASSGYGFSVFGTLKCEGTPTKPVRLISQNSMPTPGDWDGITIEPGGFASFNYTIIESTDIAITVKGPELPMKYVTISGANQGIVAESGSELNLFNVTFENCKIHDVELKTNSKMDLTKSTFKQTGNGIDYSAIKLAGSSTLKSANSTIYDKYKYSVECTGGSQATFINTNMNYSSGRVLLWDGGSRVYIKNWLDVYVANLNGTIEEPLVDSIVEIKDDGASKFTRNTNSDGLVQILPLTYLEILKNSRSYNKTDIEIDFNEIFTPSRSNVNMSISHEEQFINDLPQLNFLTVYDFPEDTLNDSFIDLYDVIVDDYYDVANNELTLVLEENTGADMGGKEMAKVWIRDGRYLAIDLTGEDNDNWTDEFAIKISAKDGLGLKNISGYIKIDVIPVNDPPMWFNMNDFNLQEDVDYLKALNVRDPNHIYDSDDVLTNITKYEVKDYDVTNYLFTVDSNYYLNIFITNPDHTGGTKATLCAYDGSDWGNYTLDVNIIPEQDAPIINRSLVDFEMDEDSYGVLPVNLYQV